MARHHATAALPLVATIVGLSWSTARLAGEPTSFEDTLLRQATAVVEQTAGASVPAIPRSIMLRTRAIAVIPAAVRDGALYYGHGVLSVRIASEIWTPPAVVAFDGAIPLELETDAVDFVLVALTPRGLGHLVSERFISPVIHDIAAGPLEELTPAAAKADVIGYVQFADYFAGVTISDWSIAEVRSSNEHLYGRPYSTDEIIRGAGFFRLPWAARQWRDAVADYFDHDAS